MLSIVHDLISWAPLGVPAFIFVVGEVIFIHELGHFLVARACGVGIKTFSIGFGPEMFGWNDKKGTRWKVSWLPIGGYVMFEGDMNAASVPDAEEGAAMTPEQKARALQFKPLWQRVAVSAAGPLANFLLAFFIFAGLLAIAGARVPASVVGGVLAKSPAAEAGLKPGDKITAVDGKKVQLFTPDLVMAVQSSKNKTLILSVERNGESFQVPITPRVIESKDIFGSTVTAKAMGVLRDDRNPKNMVWLRFPLAKIPEISALQCWGIAETSLTYLWRIVSHRADPSQLGGPIGMAQMAKSAASNGIYDLFSLVAFISVSIGLINLFPIPILDGGHLLYYACEGVLGRPLSAKIQNVGFVFGLVLVGGLMILATRNDIVRLLGSSAGHS